MTTAASTVALERMVADHGWTFFIASTRLDAALGDWQESHTESGPMLSAPVTGADAVNALERIAAVGDLFGFGSSAYRAQLDYTVPGRVACLWQSNDVWVELWHPDTPNDAPAPARARNRRKENTPA